jgi:hypothetical protein
MEDGCGEWTPAHVPVADDEESVAGNHRGHAGDRAPAPLLMKPAVRRVSPIKQGL